MLRANGRPPARLREVETALGPARALIEEPDGAPSFLLALTHGAGGGIDAPDLLAVRDAALRLGGAVARITQPYRVRGARAPGSAPRQDAAWVEIITALRGWPPGGPAGPAGPLPPRPGESLPPAGQSGLFPLAQGGLLPLVQGGRSNGARVACRTAGAAGAAAVLALAFPLHPPGRPDKSRADELRAAGVDVLVINGDRDPFGIPDEADATRVVVLPGQTHALSGAARSIEREVSVWLGAVLAGGRAVSTRARRA